MLAMMFALSFVWWGMLVMQEGINLVVNTFCYWVDVNAGATDASFATVCVE